MGDLILSAIKPSGEKFGNYLVNLTNSSPRAINFNKTTYRYSIDWVVAKTCAEDRDDMLDDATGQVVYGPTDPYINEFNSLRQAVAYLSTLPQEEFRRRVVTILMKTPFYMINDDCFNWTVENWLASFLHGIMIFVRAEKEEEVVKLLTTVFTLLLTDEKKRTSI